MNSGTHRSLALAASLGALLASGSALAQQAGGGQAANADNGVRGMEDIIVTARRTEESIQSTPVAVTAISPEKIQAVGVFQPERLGMLAPGLHVSVNTNNRDTIFFNIRGQSPEYNALFPSVIPYFAEVPLSSPISGVSRGQFYDIGRLEVLRGPQGVRFGRVTNGGAVLIEPRRPTNDLGGYVEVKAGNYNLHGAQGALNVPVVNDVLSVRAAFDITRRDGFTKNLVNGRMLDDEHSDSVRLGVLFKPIEGVENYSVYQYSNINSNGTSSVLENLTLNSNLSAALTPFGAGFAATTIQNLQDAFARQKARGVRITENGDLIYGADAGIRSKRHSHTFANVTNIQASDNIRIKNVFGYLRYSTQDGVDIDGSSVRLIDSPNSFAPIIDARQLSEEFQVSGDFFDKTLSLTAGAYFDSQKPIGPQELSYIIQVDRVERASIRLAETKSRAVYGSAELDLGRYLEGLKLNGGVRYTRDTARAPSVVYQFIGSPTVSVRPANTPIGVCQNFGTAVCEVISTESTATTYEFGASYKTSGLLVYATYRKGYRPGGVNTTVDPTAKTYLPEGNKEIEIGVKTDFRLGTVPVRLNLAAYSDDYTGIQKAVSYLYNGAVTTNIINTANGRVKGIEFEVSTRPIDGLELSLIGAYTDAKYKTGTADLFGPTGACNVNAALNIGFCTLNRFLGTPEFTYTASVNYTRPLPGNLGEISLGADWYHQSTSALTPRSYVAPTGLEPAYGLLSLNVGWSNIGGSPIDLRVFATNVTNKIYRVASSTLDYRSGIGTSAATYGEPRMIGAALRFKFGAEVK